MAAMLKQTVLAELAVLERQDTDAVLENRYRRLRAYGAYQTA